MATIGDLSASRAKLERQKAELSLANANYQAEKERAEAANLYFAGHAEVWDQIRSLHVAESEVERAIDEALGRRPLGRLVDVGTGTGRMIELFGPRSTQAIGIDRSSDMLRVARVKLEAAGIASSLRQGDMYALPLGEGRGEAHVYCVRIEPGGAIGPHEAGYGQLFLVVAGSGWVSGNDGVRRPIAAGQGAWVERV